MHPSAFPNLFISEPVFRLNPPINEKAIDHLKQIVIILYLILFSCRKLQYAMDNCIKEKMNIERPELGYFNRVRLVDTKRPRPVPNLAPMPERIPDMPDFDKMPDPEKLEQRKHMNEAMV